MILQPPPLQIKIQQDYEKKLTSVVMQIITAADWYPCVFTNHSVF
jgi:hypothetical protein